MRAPEAVVCSFTGCLQFPFIGRYCDNVACLAIAALHPALFVLRIQLFLAVLIFHLGSNQSFDLHAHPAHTTILNIFCSGSRLQTHLQIIDCIIDFSGGFFRKGISGGERKRVSIGHELLINPAILLLDEPTSGLDSTTAMRLLTTLRQLSIGGRAIVWPTNPPFPPRLSCLALFSHLAISP